MSHLRLYVVTEASPTLDELQAIMEPYRVGNPSELDGYQWDYFRVQGWGLLADLLAHPDATRAFGVIVPRRGFMRMGEVAPSVAGFYRHSLAAAGVVLHYVQVDVHT